MDQLFQTAGDEPQRTRTGVPESDAPLPVRMRPRTVDDVVGQQHLLGPGQPLRRAIAEGRAHSMLLHGPPGTGKTTLARLVAAAASAAFEELSAVEAGRPEVRKVLDRAEHRRKASGERTVLFLDEIHRFNKAQQDTLLPAVEEGLITLIGATTENPYYSVNSALLSRVRVYELQPLPDDDLEALIDRTGIDIDPDARSFLAARSGGDARTALGALEIAAEQEGRIDVERAEQALQRRAIRYDKAADQHYDYASAWIKATRGSDPDASLYYLAVMLEGGEDARFIVRRMVILASEDIGNADPQALQVAVAAAQAVEHVGLPEAAHALAQCAVYLALAPKSNAAYKALNAARAYVRENGAQLPPDYLRSSTRKDGGYEYPHDRPGHVAPQELLPDEVVGQRFYVPTATERELGERLARIRRARGRDDG
ncbi:MAG TPA: replication-associated recombination protein A [Solirubrobacteraceae bacterium]|nr:replication-associated recombination protein A [Solirubrobacteraceae bacterium]